MADMVTTKFSIEFFDIKENYTFSKIKANATDESIYQLATTINDLQEYPLKTIRKVVETELTE